MVLKSGNFKLEVFGRKYSDRKIEALLGGQSCQGRYGIRLRDVRRVKELLYIYICIVGIADVLLNRDRGKYPGSGEDSAAHST